MLSLRKFLVVRTPRALLSDTFYMSRLSPSTRCDCCTLAPLSLRHRKAAIRLAVARPCSAFELRYFRVRHIRTQEEL